ncbi:MAG: ribosome silencing factor [Lentisphaerae bacterium]|nr:ribosome silencing factor [Lentisphaerota bacterium]
MTEKQKLDEALARFCAEEASQKLGSGIVALNVREISSIADYFIIITATSVPHLKALVGHLEEEVRKKFQRRPLAIDGEPASEWVLIDFGSVLVHVMGEEARQKYALERLWSDAPQLDIALD